MQAVKEKLTEEIIEELEGLPKENSKKCSALFPHKGKRSNRPCTGVFLDKRVAEDGGRRRKRTR